ncbi:MAG: ABC transporter permease [Clostridiales bacterium]|nr:ABC transporter permease [Clostridiales bacterium]
MKSRKIYILYVLQCFFIGILVLVLLGYKMQAERKGFLDNEMFSENVHGLQMSSGELQETVDFRLPQISDQAYMLYRYLSFGANECVRGVYGTQDVFGFSKYLSSGRFFSKKDHDEAKPVAVLGSRAYSNVVVRDGKGMRFEMTIL